MLQEAAQKTIDNEKGMVLVLCLLIIVVLVLLGSVAVTTSTTDLKIAGNYKTSVQAVYSAEGGIREALERLRGTNTDANYAGDPAASIDAWWAAYILTDSSWQTSSDPDYSNYYKNYIPTTASHTTTTVTANSLQSTIPYFVKIKHKREFDAEQNGHTTLATHYFDNDGSTGINTAVSPGNIVYYGYGNAATPTTALQFTTSSATEYSPVEIITAYGLVGTSLKRIRVEAARNPGPVITSAIYAKGNITGNGSALVVDGNDNCAAAAPAKPPTYTQSPSITDPNGSPVFTPDPPGPQQGTLNIDIAGYVSSLQGSATMIITEDHDDNIGSPTNFVTCYSNTASPLNVNGLRMSNMTGYGILLVQGNLELSGGFNWNGLVLCTGVLTFNGGGAGVNIRGAVLANQTVTINGGLDIRYDSCMVSSSLNSQALNMLSWKELY